MVNQSYRKQYYKTVLKYKLQNMCAKDCHFCNLLTAKDVCRILGVDSATVIGIENLKKPFSVIAGRKEQFRSGCVIGLFDASKAEDTADVLFKLGAKAFICTRQIRDYPCFVVENVREALILLYRSIKEQYPEIKTIGVTGSIGKTTTRTILYEVYNRQYSTLISQKNSNTYSYSGYYFQCLNHKYQRYIQECHEGDRDACALMSRILQPSIMLLTNITFSHLDCFESKAAFVEEISQVTVGMPSDGIVVYNYDDDNLRSISWDRKTVTVSIECNEADYVARNIMCYEDRVDFEVVWGNNCTPLTINTPGRHNVINATLVFAASLLDGVPLGTVVEGIAAYRPAGNRQNVIRTQGVTVISDCYNAAPKSMCAAIDTLKLLHPKGNGRRIAVLGDMAELGPDSEMLHKQVGEYACNAGLDVLITYGKNRNELAGDRTCIGMQTYTAKTKKELDKLLKQHIRKDDVVLFKASNSVELNKRLLRRFVLSPKIWKSYFQA